MDTCPKNSNYDVAWQATLATILSNLKGELQVASNTSAMCHQTEPKNLTTEALFMLCVVFLFVILNLIGSFFSACGNRKVSRKEKYSPEVKRKLRMTATEEESKSSEISAVPVFENLKKFIDCFSIQKNAKKLLNPAITERNFRCLHGIRGIALLNALIAHVAMFYGTVLKSTEEFQKVLEFPLTQFVLNGIFGVDVFFILSGLLNAYFFFENYEKRKGKISWLSYYVHRYIRISPLYFIVLGFYSTLLPYLGSGSVWPDFDSNPVCKENWWWNVFYINNFNSHKKQCILVSWYLPCEMQLYAISPLFLILLMRRPKLGYGLIILGICVSCASFFGLTLQYNLIDGTAKIPYYSKDLGTFYSRFWLYFDTLYITPYTRLGSFLTGMLLGHYFYRRRFCPMERNSMVTLTLGWIACVACLWISYFALYRREESTLGTAVYNGLKHLLFSCSVSWIIFIGVTGQGGFCNRILASKVLLLLSRISYAAYLIHLVFLEGFFLSMEELYDFSVTSMVLLHIALVLVILAASFVVSLVFEAPVIRLISLLFRQNNPETATRKPAK